MHPTLQVDATLAKFSGERLAPDRLLIPAFAAFGAFAGLFAILALGGFRDAAREVSPLLPVAITAVLGALSGNWLARWPDADKVHRPEVLLVRIGGMTTLVGALSGGAIGYFTWGQDGVARFAVGGALTGALLYPGTLKVFRAAVNATRARQGSLVAAADLRTVASTLLAGVSVLAALQVPTLLQVHISQSLTPRSQALLSLVVCDVCLLFILRLMRKDKLGRSALEKATKNHAWLEPTEVVNRVAASAIDLGLGDAYYTQAAQGYRQQGNDEVQLRGSAEEAQAAFLQHELGRHYALLVSTGAFASVATAVLMRAKDLL
jgi:hypothetical protein